MNKLFITLIITFCSLNINAQQTVGLFLNDSTAFDGYTFISPSGGVHSYLLNNCGLVVNQWTATTQGGLSAYLLENGNVLRTGKIPSGVFASGGVGGLIEMYDWNNNLLWSYEHATNDYHQHHDVEYMPNGNILVLAWEFKTDSAAIAYGRDPNDVNASVWPTRISEITPIFPDSAAIVWEWHIWDHLIQNFDSTKLNYGVLEDHPELLDINTGGAAKDWLHCNSVDYNAALDQIIISSRSIAEIFIIDHSTTTAEAASHTGGNYGKGGDFLYRWGNPRNYNRGTVNDKKIFVQHDVSWIPPGYPDEGKISIFNNGQNRPAGNFGTIDIIESPVDSNGNYTLIPNQAYGPDTLYWTYDGNGSPFYSNTGCAVNQLPNGNMLMCVSNTGEIREVDFNGDLKWHYIIPVNGSNPVSQGQNPGQNSSFRIAKYGATYPGFYGQSLTPGNPIELNPYPSNCIIFTGIEESLNQSDNTIIYSDIINRQVIVKNTSTEQIELFIYDVSGKLLNHFTVDGLQEFNLPTNWEAGIYVCKIVNTKNQLINVKKIIQP